ncbi:unnamed protein product [Heligmosomoides polygyrus]|uniref:SCP domain-containing protein n=1 Tax=Heligmosomoides polygyrus TaxID=6339 RepID=A0A183G5V7_HELPZ|nr:unnamed protein product [Heligmosomoides polygyrus]
MGDATSTEKFEFFRIALQNSSPRSHRGDAYARSLTLLARCLLTAASTRRLFAPIGLPVCSLSNVAKGVSIRGQYIPPEAANMDQLLYSCELEKKADAMIASCPSELPPAPLENLAYNVHIVKEIDKNTALRTAIFYWATRYQTLEGWECITPSNKSRTAWPFYIMMNGETNALGCGIRKCNLKFYVACFYGDKVATQGKAIYYKGDPCSECPEGTTCERWEGLCKKKN